MSDAQGFPVWYELVTDDPDAAEAFYGEVVGWSFERPPGGLDRDYRIAMAGEAAIGGVMRRPAGTPLAESWLVYFAAEDPDSTAAAAADAGGRVYMPGTDIPGVGRFAFLADPQGAPFYVLRGAGEPSRAFLAMGDARPGHAVWNELTTPDPKAAIAFYGSLLGVRQEGSMPMGDLGDYSFLHVGPTAIGAVMGEAPKSRTGWQVFFMVADVDVALDRLRKAGGSVVHGPDQVPGGDYAVSADDPGGARFGFVGPRLTSSG